MKMEKLWRSMAQFSTCLSFQDHHHHLHQLQAMHKFRSTFKSSSWWFLVLNDEDIICYNGFKDHEEAEFESHIHNSKLDDLHHHHQQHQQHQQFILSLTNLKQPPNPKCTIMFWAAAKGLVCTLGFFNQKLHEILVLNILTGCSKRLPLLGVDSEIVAMVMIGDEAFYKVVIFHTFYINVYNSGSGNWKTLLSEETMFKPSTGLMVSASNRHVYYSCSSSDSEMHTLLVLDLEDWSVIRKACPPSEFLQVGHHRVLISNNLFDFRGRCLTISGLQMDGDKEDCLSVWELDQDAVENRRINNPWVLWRCMSHHLLKEFLDKAEQNAYVKQYRLEGFFTGRLIGVSLRGHSTLGGLAYDIKLDLWSHVPEYAFQASSIPIPQILSFQPDPTALP